MEPIHKKFTDTLMTKRLQTLQSIDEAVERLYHELEALGKRLKLMEKYQTNEYQKGRIRCHSCKQSIHLHFRWAWWFNMARLD